MPAAVGNTPMVELRSLSAVTGCTILAKLEYLNASGSIKDRAALAMIDEMAAQGVREAVEATAGNTGIALASMARARGMRFTACVPDTTSGPKVALLRTLADEVVLCSAQAKAGEKDHFQTRAATLAAERGARYCCQFDNPANAAAHRASTGPEMWRQSGQRANAVVLASGTGGTIAGVSQFMAPLGVPCYLANAQSSAVTVEDKTGIVRLKTEEELKHKLPSIIGLLNV
jgi:cysteine synthase